MTRYTVTLPEDDDLAEAITEAANRGANAGALIPVGVNPENPESVGAGDSITFDADSDSGDADLARFLELIQRDASVEMTEAPVVQQQRYALN